MYTGISPYGSSTSRSGLPSRPSAGPSYPPLYPMSGLPPYRRSMGSLRVGPPRIRQQPHPLLPCLSVPTGPALLPAMGATTPTPTTGMAATVERPMAARSASLFSQLLPALPRVGDGRTGSVNPWHHTSTEGPASRQAADPTVEQGAEEVGIEEYYDFPVAAELFSGSAWPPEPGHATGPSPDSNGHGMPPLSSDTGTCIGVGSGGGASTEVPLTKYRSRRPSRLDEVLSQGGAEGAAAPSAPHDADAEEGGEYLLWNILETPAAPTKAQGKAARAASFRAGGARKDTSPAEAAHPLAHRHGASSGSYLLDLYGEGYGGPQVEPRGGMWGSGKGSSYGTSAGGGSGRWGDDGTAPAGALTRLRSDRTEEELEDLFERLLSLPSGETELPARLRTVSDHRSVAAAGDSAFPPRPDPTGAQQERAFHEQYLNLLEEEEGGRGATVLEGKKTPNFCPYAAPSPFKRKAMRRRVPLPPPLSVEILAEQIMSH